MQRQPAPKLQSPDRRVGFLLMPANLDDLVEASHPVRTVWAYVERLDMSEFLAGVKSMEGQAGRSAIDPRLLLALWLYAAIDGVDSGRKLARLCKQSFPYRWLCGGVEVEYHTLNDFRSAHGAKLKKVLVNAMTGLIASGLVSPEVVAVDGVRVRAWAGGGSFRRAETLRQLKRAVEERLSSLQAAWDADGDGPEDPKPARTKARLEKQAKRLEEALSVANQLDATRREKLEADEHLTHDRRKKLERAVQKGSRASTTDPEARVLHMPDNGFRPAYVGQVATDAEHGFVLGAYVTNEGTDNAQLPVMIGKLEEDYGENTVKRALADAGFRDLSGLPAMEERGVEVYTPVPKAKKGTDRYRPRKGDSEAAVRWRQRMGSPEGQALYRRRSQLVELVFAQLRNRGLRQFRVRGQERCEATLLLHVIAHNIMLEACIRARKAA